MGTYISSPILGLLIDTFTSRLYHLFFVLRYNLLTPMSIISPIGSTMVP